MDFQNSSDVDVAYYILSEAGNSIYYKDLIMDVLTKQNKAVNSLPSAISEMYTHINMDARFQYVGDGRWGLTKWNPTSTKKRSHSAGNTTKKPVANKENTIRNKKLETIQE